MIFSLPTLWTAGGLGWAGAGPGPRVHSELGSVVSSAPPFKTLTTAPGPAPCSPAHLSYTNKQVPASSCPRVWTVTSSGG